MSELTPFESPEAVEAAERLCRELTREGKSIPNDVRERLLRHYISRDPTRDDLAFQLAVILMERGARVDADLEAASLRHCVDQEPSRMDLYDRYSIVALESLLARHREANPTPASAEAREIVETARRRLMRMKADPTEVGLPSYGVRWGEYSGRVRNAIAEMTDPAEVVRFAQSRVGFEHRLPAAQTLRHFALYETVLKAEFPNFADHAAAFSDPDLSAPETRVRIGDRWISNIVPYLTRVVFSCLTSIPAPRTVLELGGGYGAPARLWLTNPISPVRNYVIVDIPESLFFAEVFLRSEFGSNAVFNVEDETPLDPSILETYRVILCPVPRLKALDRLDIDLFVNTGSLQEMSEEWVDFYMSWLDEMKVRYFYSLNYAAQPVGNLGESVNLWSVRPSPAWTTRTARWNPGFVRTQSDRDFLESLYEKAPAGLSADEAEARLSFLGERIMTGEILIESLDVYRRCPRPEIGLSILRRTMTEMPFHPKEALWIASRLRDDPSLSAAERAEVAEHALQLERERARGVEGTT